MTIGVYFIRRPVCEQHALAPRNSVAHSVEGSHELSTAAGKVKVALNTRRTCRDRLIKCDANEIPRFVASTDGTYKRRRGAQQPCWIAAKRHAQMARGDVAY